MRIFSQEIAAFLGKSLKGENITIDLVCSLQSLQTGGLAYIKNKVVWEQFLGNNSSLTGKCLLLIPVVPAENKVVPFSYIVSENPRLDFAKVVAEFFVEKKKASISTEAKISPTAVIGHNVSIGPFCIIGDNVTIGDGSVIGNNVVLHDGVTIGRNCKIKGFASIGDEGFGFAQEKDGTWVRIPHLGTAVIEDDVEIGEFCTVCRGTLDETRIGQGTKIDDHCHIAHNVCIGKNVIITACVELSGSATVGDQSWIGPNASVLNGARIDSQSLVGIGSVVIRNVGRNYHVLGNPAKKIGVTEER